jgi:hypothetical protein
MMPSWIIEKLTRERREREAREERERARLWIEEPLQSPDPGRRPEPEPVSSTVIVIDIL